MTIRFDPVADAAYVQFRTGQSVRTEETNEGFFVDYSRTGKVIGIEVLSVSKRYPNGFKIPTKILKLVQGF